MRKWRKTFGLLGVQTYGLFENEKLCSQNIAVLMKDFSGWMLTCDILNAGYVNIAGPGVPLEAVQKQVEKAIDERLKNNKKEDDAFEKKWERIYKKKCPTSYLSLHEFVKAIDKTNVRHDDFDYRREITDIVYRHHLTIPKILNLIKERHLRIPKNVSDMICEACVCGKCDAKRHLPYTCEECKTQMSYTGYHGKCKTKYIVETL